MNQPLSNALAAVRRGSRTCVPPPFLPTGGILADEGIHITIKYVKLASRCKLTGAGVGLVSVASAALLMEAPIVNETQQIGFYQRMRSVKSVQPFRCNPRDPF